MLHVTFLLNNIFLTISNKVAAIDAHQYVVLDAPVAPFIE